MAIALGAARGFRDVCEVGGSRISGCSGGRPGHIRRLELAGACGGLGRKSGAPRALVWMTAWAQGPEW